MYFAFEKRTYILEAKWLLWAELCPPKINVAILTHITSK